MNALEDYLSAGFGPVESAPPCSQAPDKLKGKQSIDRWRSEELSYEDFVLHYMLANEPVIIEVCAISNLEAQRIMQLFLLLH